MNITVTGDLIIPGIGVCKPGDKVSVNEGTGRAIVDNRGALEGWVSKAEFNREMKARAALRDIASVEDDDEEVTDGDAHADDAEDMA